MHAKWSESTAFAHFDRPPSDDDNGGDDGGEQPYANNFHRVPDKHRFLYGVSPFDARQSVEKHRGLFANEDVADNCALALCSPRYVCCDALEVGARVRLIDAPNTGVYPVVNVEADEDVHATIKKPTAALAARG